MAGLTPTQRTLAALRELGRLSQIVEKFNPHVGKFGIRQDLFGIIDIICLDPTDGIIGVQSCGSSFAEHARTISEEKYENTTKWLKAGGKLELWGWRKVKLKRGGKALRWKPRIADVTLGDGYLEVIERR